jgi:hypothetical protein
VTSKTKADARSAAGNARSPSGSAGALKVRLFFYEDVPRLASRAQRSLAKDAGRKKIAQALNLAFYAAYKFAENDRIIVAPADLQEKCDTIVNRAGLLLRAMELPEDPRWYTRESRHWQTGGSRDPLRDSAIGYKLERAVQDIEPLPSPVLDQSWRTLSRNELEQRVARAVKAAELTPLTDRMVPSGIADQALTFETYSSLIQTHSSAELYGKSVGQIEAERAVSFLLKLAASTIALLISLATDVKQQAAEILTQQALRKRPDGRRAGPPKPNYTRTFRSELFYELASVYWKSFRTDPDIFSAVGEPGPATSWVDRILELAEQRCGRIQAVRVPRRGPVGGYALADEAERQRLIGGICEIAGLAKSTKAKRLAEEWRRFKKSSTDFVKPE